jgi:aminoglycoside phosphotransferase (APT) family kinase protein
MNENDQPAVDPAPTRFPADVGLVRRLVAEQFPRWADLPVRHVPQEGWDNRTFRLGDDMSVRLPSAAPYALAVEKEHRWLPVLAPLLPLPVPEPLAKGRPGAGYPHAWSVYRWLDGAPASRESIADLSALAVDLAGFLSALGRVDPTGGPEPGQHNWFRGGPLRTYDADTRRALDALAGRVRTGLAREIWQRALDQPWSGRPVWFHGDVSQGNLLVRDGRLAAVIDFGTSGVGDPACDLVIAWTLLSGESRAAFRKELAVDEPTWARGRGWALWKALITVAGATGGDDPEAVDASRVLDEILAEYAAG